MRLVDADEIKYLYPVDEDGNEGDGMTLESSIAEMTTIVSVIISADEVLEIVDQYCGEGKDNGRV